MGNPLDLNSDFCTATNGLMDILVVVLTIESDLKSH